MLKRFFLAIVVLTFCAFAYVTAPFYTAWSIRSAAKAGNGQYLASKIDWAAIKPGLKMSLTKLALETSGTMAHVSPRPRPSLWKRVKAFSTRVIIHGFVERYANPSGFETLVTYGRAFRAKDESDDHLPLLRRIGNVWSRVQRAAFTSLTRFEMDLLDKDDARRLYCGVFELRGFSWMLTDLRIRRLPAQQIAQLVR